MSARPHSLPAPRHSQSLSQHKPPHMRRATDLVTPARATTAATPHFAPYYHPPPLITTNLYLNLSATSSSSSTNSTTSPSTLFSSSSLLDAIASFGRGRPSPVHEDAPRLTWDSVKVSSLASFARRPSLSKLTAASYGADGPPINNSHATVTGFFPSGLWGGGEQSDDDIVYSVDMSDYEVNGIIGYGATATVYQATYRKSHPVAIKTIDMDRFARHQVDQLRKEIQIMSLCRHENVLPVFRSFVHDSKLHVVTKLMTAGSVLDILRAGGMTGVDEASIATILKQCFQGLDYLHRSMLVHRDVKSANLLLDRATGLVTLADFGVSDRLSQSLTPRKRTSFVGTPCWMAPEVIEQQQYDCRADIWSVGITALELAYGRAPSWRLALADVLIRTIQEAPPTLQPELCSHVYSSSLKDFVDACLSKDPSRRPTAAQLLCHPFFRRVRSKAYLVTSLGLNRLPTLDERAREIAQTERNAAAVFEDWDFTSAAPAPDPSTRPSHVRIITANLPRHLPASSASSSHSSSSSDASSVSPGSLPVTPPSSAPIPIPSRPKFAKREEEFGCGLEARRDVRSFAMV